MSCVYPCWFLLLLHRITLCEYTAIFYLTSIWVVFSLGDCEQRCPKHSFVGFGVSLSFCVGHVMHVRLTL